MRRTWIAAALLLTLAPAGSQAAGLPGFGLVGRSQRLSLYARQGRRANVKPLEEHLARFEQLLGQSVGHADFYQYDYPEELAVATGYNGGGVTFAQTSEVHATRPASDHELVHLVGHALGRPGPFFQEGLAVLLGDGGKYRGVKVDELARGLHGGRRLTRLIAAFDAREPGEGYALAGSFVGYLARHYGLARVAAFFRATARFTPDAAFVATFGHDLDEEGVRWTQSL